MSTYELIGSRGCGSAIIEMALDLAAIPYTVTDLPYLKPEPGRHRLLRLNATRQVPTLAFPGGEVMTESTAMVLHMGAVAPAAGRGPPAHNTDRERVRRWLVRTVGVVYPQFPYADEPAKWTTPGGPAELLRTRVHTRRAELWQEIDRLAGAPHALGRRFSALDLYISVMIRWRPGPAWFKENCPALYAIAEQAAAQPDVGKVLARHFDPPLE